MKPNKCLFTIKRVTDICLYFLFACVPLIVNPFAYDCWYKPKINSVYALIIIILIAIGIRNLLFNSPLRFRSIPVLIPLIAYAGSAIISTIFSISPRLSLAGDMYRQEGLFAILSYVSLTFLFSQLVESEKQIQSLVKGLFISALIISIYGIMNYNGYYPIKQLVPNPEQKGLGLGSLIGNANFLGKFLVLIMPLSIAYYLTAINEARKYFYGAVFMLCLFSLIVTFTRASWLSFIVGLVIFAFIIGREIFRNNMRKILVSVLVICFIAGISFYALLLHGESKENIFDIVKKRIYSSFDLEKGIGITTRLFVWKRTIGLIQERPLVGYGPDTHVKAMSKLNLEYGLEFNEWVLREEWGKKILRFNKWTVLDRAHNNYLDITIGQGLIGLVTYLSIILAFLVWLRRIIKQEEDISKRTIYCGIFAAFCGCLINDFFIFSVVSVSPTFWSLMGITFAMKNVRT